MQQQEEYEEAAGEEQEQGQVQVSHGKAFSSPALSLPRIEHRDTGLAHQIGRKEN